jgi:hypothetical protein
VHDSLKQGRGHRSDQGAVWEEVDRKARLHDAPSPTDALQDSRSHLSEKLDAFERLAEELPEGTCGVAVALGDRPVLLEVLAGPRSFARVSRKLVSGYAFDAVGLLGGRDGAPDPSAVRAFIETAMRARHEEHPAVGSGRDVRFDEDGVSGYAHGEGAEGERGGCRRPGASLPPRGVLQPGHNCKYVPHDAQPM